MSQASASVIFSIFYFIFCLGFVYQSREFDSAGISPEALLTYNDWIGSEDVRFFSYHMKRTAGTLVLQSLLPLGTFSCWRCSHIKPVSLKDIFSASVTLLCSWMVIMTHSWSSGTPTLSSINACWPQYYCQCWHCHSLGSGHSTTGPTIPWSPSSGCMPEMVSVDQSEHSIENNWPIRTQYWQ